MALPLKDAIFIMSMVTINQFYGGCPMGLFLEVLDGSGAENFVAWHELNYVESGMRRVYLRELYFADPILWILVKRHYRPRIARYDTRTADKPTSLLKPKATNPYMAGIQAISRLLRKRRNESFQRSFPGWHARRSVSIYGQSGFLNQSNLTVNNIVDNVVLPLGVSNVPVQTTRYMSSSGPRDHLSFDDLRELAFRLQAYVGQAFRRNGSLGSFGTHILVSLSVERNQIDYVLSNIDFNGYPSGTRLQCGTLKISLVRNLDPLSANTILIRMSGQNSAKVDNVGSKQPKFNPDIWGSSFVSPPLSYNVNLANWRNNALGAGTWHINEFAPALYHTQAQAVNKILVNYGKNFENLVELPALVNSIRDLASQRSEDVLKFFSSDLPWISRVKNLSKMLSGSILMWNFSLRPTIETLKGLVQPLLLPDRGESSMIFEGTDVSLLPPGLRSTAFRGLIRLGLSDADVLRYQFVFRSQAYTSPDYLTAARALMEQNPFIAAGILPTPKAIWDVAQFSFIVDWFLPIGKFIDDNSAYFRSPTLPLRIGHTVSIEIRLKTGYTLETFMRSSEVDHLFDPPAESWLFASGPPVISIPLAVSMLIDYRSSKSKVWNERQQTLSQVRDPRGSYELF